MNHSPTFRMTGHFSIALVCAVLTACATTQRSSTSAADQAATPPAAASTEKTAAPPSAPAPTSQAATAAGSPPASKATAKADESGPMEFPSTNNDTASETKPAEQAGELKQKLEQQDAEISKIRQRQETQATSMDKEATPENQAEATAAADSPAAPRKESAAAPRKEEDAMAFPERKDTAEPATQTRSSIPKPVERSVYFNYDEASVLARYDAMLLANAAYLKEHSGADVEVQGNCDERGSREYNLALGARRAEQVKRALEVGGVDRNRIHTVSFGKEKPVAMGQDEESYSKNRRADIVY